MPPTMVPNPHDLIAYARDRIVIGEVLSVDGRNVTVRGPNNVATTVPLADILATYPRPDLANLHTTVNKLTAEAQAVHSALTAAGVTAPGTLAERVKVLANDCAIYCRCNNEKAQQMNDAHAAVDKVPSIPRTGTLAERIAALASTHNQSHAAADKVIPETRAAVLDVRVSALVAKYLNQSDLLREAKGESERLREKNKVLEEEQTNDSHARNNAKAHAILDDEPSVMWNAYLPDRVQSLLDKYRALKAEQEFNIRVHKMLDGEPSVTRNGNLPERVANLMARYRTAAEQVSSQSFVAKSHDHIDAVLGRIPHDRMLDERVAALVEKYKDLKAENKALREKTAWTIVDLGTLYGGKGASATPQVAPGSGGAGGGTTYVWAPVGTGRSVQVPTSPPETTITVPAGANVRVVVEKA